MVIQLSYIFEDHSLTVANISCLLRIIICIYYFDEACGEIALYIKQTGCGCRYSWHHLINTGVNFVLNVAENHLLLPLWKTLIPEGINQKINGTLLHLLKWKAFGTSLLLIYQAGRKNGYTAQELAEIIFSVPEDKFLCRKQPLRIRSKKTFLIDLQFIALEDLTTYDNVPYKHQGTRTKVCTVDLDEECHIREFKITDRKRKELHARNSLYSIERNRVCKSYDALKTRTPYYEGKKNDYDDCSLQKQ